MAETRLSDRLGSTGIRKPQQARSRARLERMLVEADQILAIEGFDALTMRGLAERANVPVGTIYQYFPDKAAVVDSLARSYIARFHHVVVELIERAGTERWTDPISVIFDAFVAQHRAMPGYRALWQVGQVPPDLLLAEDSNNVLIADGIRQIIVESLGVKDDDTLARLCVVAVQIGDALLQLAFRLDPNGDPTVLRLAKRMQSVLLDELGRP